MWEYRARLERVIDADTVRLVADLGFDAHHRIDVRLLDVSAPELTEADGTAAREFTEAWFRSTDLYLRWPLLVVTATTRLAEPTELRTFTRYVGTIWAIDARDSPSLNEALAEWLTLRTEARQ